MTRKKQILKVAGTFALEAWRKINVLVRDKSLRSDAHRSGIAASVVVGIFSVMLFVGPLIEAGIFVLCFAVYFGVRGLVGNAAEELEHE